MSSAEESLAKEVYAVQAVNRNAVAALSFTLWDILITFDDEANFVWTKSWEDPVKTLFLAVRYYGLAAQIAMLARNILTADGAVFSAAQCRAWFALQIATIPIVMSCMQLVLCIRVSALWGHTRRVKLLLAGLWIFSVGAVIVTMGTHVSLIPLSEDCQPNGMGNKGLALPATKRMFWLLAVFPLVMEVSLVGLTAYKFSIAVAEGWGRTPILTLVVRDGIWAFALTLLTSIANAATSLGVTSYLGIMSYNWAVASYSFSGSRLVLNALSSPAARKASTRGETLRTTRGAVLTTQILSEDVGYDELDDGGLHMELGAVDVRSLGTRKVPRSDGDGGSSVMSTLGGSLP